MATTREALEAALAAEPESVALHSAYADLLIEEGDPRGEYIRLELIQEDKNQSAEILSTAALTSFEMLLEYEREWLKPLDSKALAASWVRGWIDELSYVDSISEIEASKLTRCPMIQSLRSLTINGSETDSEQLIWTLAKVPFQELRLNYLADYGDRLIELLIETRIIQRIQSLALTSCAITDDGAELLAQSTHVRNLKSLNLDNNHLSPIGISALAEVGFTIGPQLDNPAWEADRHNPGRSADAD